MHNDNDYAAAASDDDCDDDNNDKGAEFFFFFLKCSCTSVGDFSCVSCKHVPPTSILCCQQNPNNPCPWFVCKRVRTRLCAYVYVCVRTDTWDDRGGLHDVWPILPARACDRGDGRRGVGVGCCM